MRPPDGQNGRRDRLRLVTAVTGSRHSPSLHGQTPHCRRGSRSRPMRERSTRECTLRDGIHGDVSPCSTGALPTTVGEKQNVCRAQRTMHFLAKPPPGKKMSVQSMPKPRPHRGKTGNALAPIQSSLPSSYTRVRTLSMYEQPHAYALFRISPCPVGSLVFGTTPGQNTAVRIYSRAWRYTETHS